MVMNTNPLEPRVKGTQLLGIFKLHGKKFCLATCLFEAAGHTWKTISCYMIVCRQELATIILSQNLRDHSR